MNLQELIDQMSEQARWVAEWGRLGSRLLGIDPDGTLVLDTEGF